MVGEKRVPASDVKRYLTNFEICKERSLDVGEGWIRFVIRRKLSISHSPIFVELGSGIDEEVLIYGWTEAEAPDYNSEEDRNSSDWKSFVELTRKSRGVFTDIQKDANIMPKGVVLPCSTLFKEQVNDVPNLVKLIGLMVSTEIWHFGGMIVERDDKEAIKVKDHLKPSNQALNVAIFTSMILNVRDGIAQHKMDFTEESEILGILCEASNKYERREIQKNVLQDRRRVYYLEEDGERSSSSLEHGEIDDDNHLNFKDAPDNHSEEQRAQFRSGLIKESVVSSNSKGWLNLKRSYEYWTDRASRCDGDVSECD